MPALSSKARQAVMLAALTGCALALGPSREAGAAACHVADRPVFGLSSDPGDRAPVTVDGTVIVEAPSPIEIEQRCPSEDSERPPLRSSVWSGDSSLLEWIDPIPNEPSDLLRPEADAERPIRRCVRIDRPPRLR
ncbi:hypothetical protein [Tautonia rosea]|uniref:hypothetical protein n=1 Tax=Tautonia rosea TaxID=2728037 RepID=UPI00147616CA|nr:hypothetical protein [Tautonia rosea]